SHRNPLFNAQLALAPAAKGNYRSVAVEPWAKVALNDKIAFVSDAGRSLKTDNRIVDWSASILHSHTENYFCSTTGSEIEQVVEVNVPFMSVTAHGGGQTTHRSLNGMAHCRQGGFELVRSLAVAEKAGKISREALELLTAPNCPDGVMSLLLSPDQMYIQIHESIGHPLELDRVLGDER